MKTVKVNYILDAHKKKYFETVNAKKIWKLDYKHQRYGVKCEKLKNSQKP
jgi:hypothetical protein